MIPKESPVRGLTIPPDTAKLRVRPTGKVLPLPPATDPWKKLGTQLVRRRIELNPAYHNRQTFVTERRLNYRTVSDIENGRRDNYEPQTISAIEVAYAVAPGSVRAAIAGGELEPLAAPEPSRREAPASPAADGDAAIERLIILLIEHIDPDWPKLRKALELAMELQDGNGGPMPLARRAQLMLREIFEDAPDVRRNGTTDLPPSA